MRENGVDFIMILFEYTCINLEINDNEQVAGFRISLGEEWKDLIIYEVKRSGKVIVESSRTVMLNNEWLNYFLKVIDEQKEIMNLSSWIYKLGAHSTEHKFMVEGSGWNKEIGIYNLGKLVNYEYESYREEEKVLIHFMDKVIKLFHEHNIELGYSSINI